MSHSSTITGDHDAATPPKGNPTLERFLWGMLILIVSGLVVGSAWAFRSRSGTARQGVQVVALTTPGDAIGHAVCDFSLIDHTGNKVTLADLKGKVWVAEFFFTQCQGVCPMMSMRMSQLHKAVPPDADVKLVSITHDPHRDSPEVLAEYAKKFGAEDGRWLFLTGDQQEIIRLTMDGFKLPASENPNTHSSRFTLVDRDGRIRGYYDSTDEKSVAQLEQDLKKLAEETGLAEEKP